MISSNIFLATAFQDMLWLVLLIAFAILIYNWTKSQVVNQTVAILLTLLLTYIMFIRFPELVWIFIIGIVVFWIYGEDIKSAILKIKINK